eukprot:TRINITY_DN1094_c0_g1_i11.p1 TRINITY_DN1094_c0_g1~~TRINITY_DN1094_c0_g1_i11.p1  ORF type:complete len:114 (+),score=31.83 TRINITY_DN1094_c0_g1_i11:130-471(+)
MKNLTGTQKLRLISARIFGENIGGNYSSGNKPMKAPLTGPGRLARYDIPIWAPRWVVPSLIEHREIWWRKQLEEQRKLRFLMRGIKIGKKKGGVKTSIINVFERKGVKIRDRD